MKKIIVYGKGCFWEKYKVDVQRDYEVIGFLDSKYTGEFESKRCYKISEFDIDSSYDYILIMVLNTNHIFEMLENLIQRGIDFSKIKLGYFEYEKNGVFYHKAQLTSEGTIVLNMDGDEIEVYSAVELSGVLGTIDRRAYEFFLNNSKKSIVFDIGANIGDSALFFLKKDDVEKVYAYEPFEQTYSKAINNLKNYIKSPRLELFNYGLSNCNEQRRLDLYEGMSTGLSTSSEYLKKNEIQLKAYIRDKNRKYTTVEVRKASEVLGNIILDYSKNYNIILKIDCEGEEFAIIGDMSDSGLLKCVDLLMLEWHYNDEKIITDQLKRNGFSYVLNDKPVDLGLIWAWK